MYMHSAQSLAAEICWRQERVKRDFQRPFWFQRKAVKPVTQRPCLPAVEARHAM